MKKFVVLLLSIVTCIACLVSCNKTDDVDCVVIVIEQDYLKDIKNATLIDYMNKMMDKKELTFTMQGTLVDSINGVKNTTNSYWMLYTNDTENSNSAWGTYEYDGVTYSSASVGAGTLTVKVGYVYIWAYTTF